MILHSPEEAIGHNAMAAGFRDRDSGQISIQTVTFAEAMLNTSFDWNGAREPYILATENDVQRTWNDVHETSYKQSSDLR